MEECFLSCLDLYFFNGDSSSYCQGIFFGSDYPFGFIDYDCPGKKALLGFGNLSFQV